MATVTIGDYKLEIVEGLDVERYEDRARLVDKVDLELEDAASFTLAVGKVGSEPEIALGQKYEPATSGSDAGILLLPEAKMLFVGAGQRIAAYSLVSAERLWLETVDGCFWRWRQHGDVVIMSASHEVSCWTTQGTKLWSQLIEPIWSYEVAKDRMLLKLISHALEFSLYEGPDKEGLRELYE